MFREKLERYGIAPIVCSYCLGWGEVPDYNKSGRDQADCDYKVCPKCLGERMLFKKEQVLTLTDAMLYVDKL